MGAHVTVRDMQLLLDPIRRDVSDMRQHILTLERELGQHERADERHKIVVNTLAGMKRDFDRIKGDERAESTQCGLRR